MSRCFLPALVLGKMYNNQNETKKGQGGGVAGLYLDAAHTFRPPYFQNLPKKELVSPTGTHELGA